MDFSLLHSWLHLPAGPWPPDHYALLALAPETRDPAVIERHVMERMEVLRRHQLRHPELVTLGMNQLAQAFVCLSDENERTAYNARLGLAAAPVPVQVVAPPEPGREDFEPLPEEDLLSAPVVQAEAASTPRTTRWVYRRLALVRRCRRAWDDLAMVLALPEQSLDQPAALYRFLLAAESVRPILPDLRGVFEDGRIDASFALRLLDELDPASVIRGLAMEDRTTLAIEWRRGRTAIEEELQRLRSLVPQPPRRAFARTLARIMRRVRQSPEILLVILVTAAVVSALIRSSTGR